MTFPRGALVLRVVAGAEAREIERADAVYVAGEAVDQRAARAEMLCASRHQFAPQRVARRRAAGDIDLAGLQIVERLEHQAERLRHQRIAGLAVLRGKMSASSTGMARPISRVCSSTGL